MHNHEAEQRIIAGMLFGLEADQQAIVLRTLDADDFEDATHRSIFSAIRRLADAGTPVDELTVSSELNGSPTVAELSELSESITSLAGLMGWVEMVKTLSTNRELRRIFEEQQAILEQVPGSREALSEAIAAVADVQVSVSTARPSWGDCVRETLKAIEDKSKGMSPALSTGIPDLDEQLNGGFRPGEFIIVSGWPGSGKTALAGQCIWANATKGKSVYFASLEMSTQQMIERTIAHDARIPSTRVHSGNLQPTDWPKAARAMGRISEARKLYIDSSPAILTVAGIRTEALRHRAKHGLDLLVIDYAQLVNGPGRSRYEIVTHTSIAIKHLAVELNVPVLVVAQLRKPEGDKLPVPNKFHIKDSGQLMQDAHTVILLNKQDDMIVDAIVDKQRSGPEGVVSLVFERATYSFRGM